MLLGVFLALSWSPPISLAGNESSSALGGTGQMIMVSNVCSGCNEDGIDVSDAMCVLMCGNLVPGTLPATAADYSVDEHGSLPIDEILSASRTYSPEPYPPKPTDIV